jgi:hypothetical protein
METKSERTSLWKKEAGKLFNFDVATLLMVNPLELHLGIDGNVAVALLKVDLDRRLTRRKSGNKNRKCPRYFQPIVIFARHVKLCIASIQIGRLKSEIYYILCMYQMYVCMYVVLA